MDFRPYNEDITVRNKTNKWTSNFTCMTNLFHMCEKISHEIKCMEKKFSHMTKLFHMYYRISHACQKVHMHVKFWCGELVFLPTLISHGSFFFHTLFTPFSHDFHRHSPRPSLSSFELAIACNEVVSYVLPVTSGKNTTKQFSLTEKKKSLLMFFFKRTNILF